MLELPISVAPLTGLPLLGSLISLLPASAFRALALAPALQG